MDAKIDSRQMYQYQTKISTGGNKMDTDGFEFDTMSRIFRETSKMLGVSSGRWEPVGNQSLDDADDDQVVARVWNTRKSIVITAGNVRYTMRYLK